MDVESVLQSLISLPQGDNVNLTYVWIDGTGESLRSKSRSSNKIPTSPGDCPIWNFDGSSTGQAETSASDVLLVPVTLYKDPFLRGDHMLVLCECLNYKQQSAKGNCRNSCAQSMAKVAKDEPWFAFEQEFVVLDNKTDRPLGWPERGLSDPHGPSYCGANLDKRARALIEGHSFACRYAGVPISGTNAEVLLGQWEYQVGPSTGIKFGDDVWISRYILDRIAEKLDLRITFDPKPVPGYNGSGAHINFSTKQTRQPGGLKVIHEYVESLAKNHQKHIAVYDPRGGADNARRLIGTNETSSIDKFSSGIGDRTASVRINTSVAEANCGYLEDRRPASNADPYAVSEALVRTCCLKE
ncbi:glutamine synthetase, mitochondrial-like [Panonychus citri]|uniref:glutamine synthetase, mitochondrial-like n=1 Tax=Panonychus citri TaxID=50023 RepID=UPI0023078E6D|nr:glutamine synthetase, mitochondrial-like [Panonychus citri]